MGLREGEEADVEEKGGGARAGRAVRAGAGAERGKESTGRVSGWRGEGASGGRCRGANG